MKGRSKFKFLGVILFAIMAAAGVSWLVMFLWNFALVPAVGFSEITYWQAVAILILSKILFTGFSPKGGKHRSHWKKKWEGMSDEEKANFKAKMKHKWDTKNRPNDS